MRRHFVLISTAVLLTACGFHLRGSQNETPLPFKTLGIAGDVNSLVARDLRDTIKGQVIVLTPPATGQVNVEIGEIKHSKAILTKDVDGRASEYRLYASVVIQAYAANKDLLLKPSTISVTRTQTTGNGYDTGVDLETTRMYAEMDADLANQIQYRLRAIKMNP